MANLFQITDALWGCEVPLDASDLVIDGDLFYKSFFVVDKVKHHLKRLPTGNWSIIGTITKDANLSPTKELIEQITGKTWTNPLGEEEELSKRRAEGLSKWQKAEQNLLQKVVILELKS